MRKIWKKLKKTSKIDLLLWAGTFAAIMTVGAAKIVGPIVGISQSFEALPTSVVGEVASQFGDRKGRHLGFDTNIYPGDKIMQAWKGAESPYEWVGYYLAAPCHKDPSWMGKRETLRKMGWGLAVIYVGQQTWGRTPGVPRMIPVKVMHREVVTIKKKGKRYKVNKLVARTKWVPEPPPRATASCSAEFVKGPRGQIEAFDAIAQTEAEGFEHGSTIFLDIEYMDFVPSRMKDYYTQWTATVLADGRYKPGYYVHTRNAEVVYRDIKGVFVAAGFNGDPSFWVAGKSGLFDGELGPEHVGHTFAAVWQGLLDKVDVRNGFELPVDINVAKVPDPSAKEYALTD